MRRLGVPFIAPKGLGAVGASFGSSQPSLVAGAPDCPVAHRTVNSNRSDWQFPSLEQLAVGAPDRLLFTVLCTGQVTIHCPVHRTELLFTVLCTGHLLFTVLCTSQQHTKCFSPFFLRLTSTFGRIFLRLKQTHLEYNPIDLVLETYIFFVLLLAFLFLLQQSSEWYFLYRKS